MSSVHYLRAFVTERLTAAAAEILGVFEKTIAEYQEEIDRQRRLLDIVLRPQIKLQRIELPQQHICKEEEVLTQQQQQLCNQETSSSLDQEEQESPQIKKEEEFCSSQDVEKTETSMIKLPSDVVLQPQIKLCRIDPPQQRVYKEKEVLTDCNQKRNPSLDQKEAEPPQIKEEQEEFCSSLEQEQPVLRQETDTSMLISTNEESDHQLLSPSSAVAKSQDQEVSQRVDSGSTRDAEPEPKRKCYKNTGHMTNVENPSVSVNKCKTKGGKKLLECDFCGKTFKIKYLLNKHVRVHTGEKAYCCSICGKEYDEWPEFQMHMKSVHTIEKPYLCTTCGDRFYQMSHLTNHVKVHIREETYIKTYGSPFRLYLNMRRAQLVETQHQCNT